GRRPILSATIVKTSDPTSTPKLPAASMLPSADPGTFHSRINDGPTYPTACTSKPSMMRHAAQRAKRTTCSDPTLLRSMTSAILISVGDTAGVAMSVPFNDSYRDEDAEVAEHAHLYRRGRNERRESQSTKALRPPRPLR